MQELIPQLLAIWRSPQFQALVDVFVWLCSVNGGFWILARASGALINVFSEIVWEPLWSALAVLYNLALAAVFSAVIAASATYGAPAEDLLWRKMCGFVMLYLALSASYMDTKTGEIEEHAKVGFAVGLLAYLIFAAVPGLVRSPDLLDSISLMKAVADSWLGRAMAAAVVAGIAWRIATRGLRELFQCLAPALYMVGAIRHPAIRVRRRG